MAQPTRLARLTQQQSVVWNTSTLGSVEYEITEEVIACTFFDPKRKKVAELRIPFVSISFYAKQHLEKKPPLLDCGVIIENGSVEKFLIPTGRTRMAGNGSIAVKCIDLATPVPEDEVEKYERVGIRPPDGVFTYAFFEASYLARSEDPRRGALFLIDPSMIILQQPMTDLQKKEFETFGGRKVLYFDVLGAPNLQERREEIKRCRMRGEIRRMQYAEADKKWEDEMQDRIALKDEEEAEKPKLSKKAKQKARQAAKDGKKNDGESHTEAEAEAERLHKIKQAESKAKQDEDARLERELEATRKKAEVAEVKREAEAEARRMGSMKSLLQKLSTLSLESKQQDEPDDSKAQIWQAAEVVEDSAEESSDDADVLLRRDRKPAASSSDGTAAGYPS